MTEAFDGDPYIEEELWRLVKKWNIHTIIETGTFKGHSTEALADMAPEVLTIEINPACEKTWPNVRQCIGDSVTLLPDMLLYATPPFLFYLDAHWLDHSPLLDELDIIATAWLKPVIAIHDFFNPKHPEYGYDTWDIGTYRLELIEPSLEIIYGPDGWTHWYNTNAEGSKRGIIYVEPK
jgi:hypothetical protein